MNKHSISIKKAIQKPPKPKLKTRVLQKMQSEYLAWNKNYESLLNDLKVPTYEELKTMTHENEPLTGLFEALAYIPENMLDIDDEEEKRKYAEESLDEAFNSGNIRAHISYEGLSDFMETVEKKHNMWFHLIRDPALVSENLADDLAEIETKGLFVKWTPATKEVTILVSMDELTFRWNATKGYFENDTNEDYAQAQLYFKDGVAPSGLSYPMYDFC